MRTKYLSAQNVIIEQVTAAATIAKEQGPNGNVNGNGDRGFLKPEHVYKFEPSSLTDSMNICADLESDKENSGTTGTLARWFPSSGLICYWYEYQNSKNLRTSGAL